MSASLGAAAVVPPAGSPIVARFEPLNMPGSQGRLSSVQLSPNRVRPDFDVDTENLYPLFEMSPVPDGDLSLISPATTQELLSPPPPAPLPSSIQIKIDPALLLRLATANQEWFPHPPPYLLRSHD